jgi:F-type H+-transporting ATPase subunit b
MRLIPLAIGLLIGMVISPLCLAWDPPLEKSKPGAAQKHDVAEKHDAAGHGQPAGGDAHTKDHNGGGGHGGGGGPISIDLGIWTLVVFILLYLVLRYVKLPGAPAPAFVMMIDGLKRREENIAGALDAARQARRDAEQLQANLQEQRNKMGEEIRAHLEEARKDALRVRDELVAQARADIQTERERLHREISLARDAALQDIWHQAANLAALISAKAIRKQLSPEDHSRLIDEALTDLRRAESGRRNGHT